MTSWCPDTLCHFQQQSERENGACTFLGVLIHSTDKPQPMALHAYCHGVPAERVVSRINPRTEITMDILNVQFIALINLFIRFIKFNKQWNFTTKHYGLFCNTIISLGNVTCHNQQRKILILRNSDDYVISKQYTKYMLSFLHTF